ncbi:MAG: polymer-forming cytoskeletal protein [Clostridia bacterium]|nr:polymer-forming cytoskeletal protein [Clostridia bacterium]
MVDNNEVMENMENMETTETEYATEEVTNSELVVDVIEEFAVITEDTTVEGNIKTKGHLAVAGTVKGDIVAKGNLIITGLVKGKIQCNNVVLDKCELKTDIEADGEVTVRVGSKITGSIHCKDIAVDGEVIGNIVASNTLAIATNASVRGDVKAKSIGMGFGGKLTGNISMHDEDF